MALSLKYDIKDETQQKRGIRFLIVEGTYIYIYIYIPLAHIWKGAAFLHLGATNCDFCKLVLK